MNNNVNLYVFLLIAVVSFINWIASQIKEKKDLARIAEQRQKTAAHPDENTALAQARQEKLRELRQAQAQRTRERVRVLTGQPPAGQPGTVPTAPTAGMPTGTPAQGRPLRPGRSARRVRTTSQQAPRQTQAQAQAQAQRPTGTGGNVRRSILPSESRRPHAVLPSDAPPEHTLLPSEHPAEQPRAASTRRGRTDWARAIVLSEILAPPVSIRAPEEQ